MDKIKSLFRKVPHIEKLKEMKRKTEKAVFWFLSMFCMFVLCVVYYAFAIGAFWALLALILIGKIMPLIIVVCIVLGLFLWWS